MACPYPRDDEVLDVDGDDMAAPPGVRRRPGGWSAAGAGPAYGVEPACVAARRVARRPVRSPDRPPPTASDCAAPPEDRGTYHCRGHGDEPRGRSCSRRRRRDRKAAANAEDSRLERDVLAQDPGRAARHIAYRGVLRRVATTVRGLADGEERATAPPPPRA